MEINQSQGLITLESYNPEDVLVKKSVGLWLKDSGHIITGVDILENCTNIKILRDNKRVTLKYAWLDLENHILILKSDILSNSSISIGDSNNLKLGERIFITKGSEFSVLTESNINGLSKLRHQSLYNVRLFSNRYFKYSNQGNNGNFQFVFNEKHELIGVFTKTKTGSHSINNFALRINELNLLTQAEKRSYYPIKDIGVIYNAEDMYQRKEYEKAIQYYNAFLADNSDNYYIILERAKAFINKMDFKQAIADCDKAIKLKPDYALSYAVKAFAYVKQKDFSNAAGLFTEAINREPLYIDNHFNAAYCFHKILNYENAFKSMNELQELNHNIAAIYQIKGDLNFEKRLYGGAIEMYEKAYQLDKENTYLYFLMSNAHIAKENFHDALWSTNQALEHFKNDPFIYHNKAVCISRIGTIDEAIYNETLAIQVSENPLFYTFRAIFYFYAKDFAKSIQDFKNSLTLQSDLNNIRNYFSTVFIRIIDADTEKDSDLINFGSDLITETENLFTQIPDKEIHKFYTEIKRDFINALQAKSLAVIGKHRDKITKQKDAEFPFIETKKIFCELDSTNFIRAFLLQEQNDKVKLILFEDKDDLQEIIHSNFEFKNKTDVNAETANSKMKWSEKYTLALLTYFIKQLKENNIINVKPRNFNCLIRFHFCEQSGKNFSLEAVSRALGKTKNNTGRKSGKKGAPMAYEYVDDFIEYLKQ